jgi:dipeptidyl aminopeptidase/acylaminoacyl peptidase
VPQPATPTPVDSPDANLPVTAGLELQPDDYAQVRREFRTKLLRNGPSPQRWKAVQAPKDVAVVEYPSGDLRLKAWVNRPAKVDGKQPAVLFLHGGWAFGADDWEMAEPFRDAGFVVMAPLLRGENGQPGNFTMFYDEVDDVLAAADALAKIPGVDPARIYLSGHSAGGTLTMLAAMASDRFRAAASLSGSADRIAFVRSGFQKVTPFDQHEIREFQVRSAVAYATSFKCPTRLYYGKDESYFDGETRRTAGLAKRKGLDVEAVQVPGDHMSCVPAAMQQAIRFFQTK